MGIDKVEYLSNPMSCPNCGGQELLTGELQQIEYHTVWQDNECNTCGSEWRDLYKLSDVVRVEISNDHIHDQTGTDS